MCKAVAYIQGVSVAASVYSLVAVSLDRYVQYYVRFLYLWRTMYGYSARGKVFNITYSTRTRVYVK